MLVYAQSCGDFAGRECRLYRRSCGRSCHSSGATGEHNAHAATHLVQSRWSTPLLEICVEYLKFDTCEAKLQSQLLSEPCNVVAGDLQRTAFRSQLTRLQFHRQEHQITARCCWCARSVARNAGGRRAGCCVWRGRGCWRRWPTRWPASSTCRLFPRPCVRSWTSDR